MDVLTLTLRGATSSFFPNQQTEKKTPSTITGLFSCYACVPTTSTVTWEKIKMEGMRSIELMPDLVTVCDSSIKLLEAFRGAVPTWLKVAFASTATLNGCLVPFFVTQCYHMISRMLSKLSVGRAAGADQVLRFSYFFSLGSAVLALCAMGLKEFGAMARIVPPGVQRIMDLIFPWVSYGIRLSAILQLMNVWAGARFEAAIKSDCCVKSELDEARTKIDVIHDFRRYLRRSNGSAKRLNETTEHLQSALYSWNPIKRHTAVKETLSLAKKLRERSIAYVREQAFGLGANIFAVFAMLLTNVVAVAAFSLCSAIYYLTQTTYSWNMAPPVTFGGKGPWLTWEDKHFLSALGSLGGRIIGTVL